MGIGKKEGVDRANEGVVMVVVFLQYDEGSFCVMISSVEYLKKNNFMAPFYRWGSTASRLQPLRGGSLVFTIQFPEIPGTHFINLGRMKGWVDLGATQWFWAWDSWIGNPASKPLGHCSINGMERFWSTYKNK